LTGQELVRSEKISAKEKGDQLLVTFKKPAYISVISGVSNEKPGYVFLECTLKLKAGMVGIAL